MCPVPGAMNKQGNGRVMKEGSGNLKIQSTTLPKTRSRPRACGANGQFQAADESLLDYETSFPEVLDVARGPGDDDYEAPRLPVARAWQLMKILPAKPLKESEYADTRCFEDVVDPPLSLDGTRSLPTEGPTWNMQVDNPTSRDIGSRHIKGDRPTKGNKTPLLPPRLPVLPLPKKYQPLPPEPEQESSRSPLPQRHTFPEVQRGPRQISLKNLSEVLGTEKVPYQQMKPQAPHLSQNQSFPEIPQAIASSSFTASSRSMQNQDRKGSMQPHPAQSCQSPASFDPWESSLPPGATSRRKPLPTRPDGKATQPSRWYVGGCSRREVEEALLKENKDGTFLVRDCSVKSQTEPYVLAVFYGSRVYNVKIRFLERSQQFVLGTGLRGGEFDSVEDIIEHYKYFPIVLIDGKDKTGARREQCYLTRPLPLGRLSSPR